VSTGALVTVRPPGHARLAKTFPASDGRPAAVALLLSGPVVVRARVGGRDQGSRGEPNAVRIQTERADAAGQYPDGCR
jgi:hypothetical protein